MKKLIKRLEELAVENDMLTNDNWRLRVENDRLRKYEPRIVGHEWFGGDIKDGKIKGRLIYDGEAESIVKDIFVDEMKKRLEELMNDTGVTKDTSCFDGLLSKMQDSQDFKKRGDDVEEEERPKTTSTYEELGSQPKELEEAKEILKDWRFGKCTYSSDEIDRAIDKILKHLDKHNY